MRIPSRLSAVLFTALLALPVGTAHAATTTWPGDPAVTVADASGVFGENLSGLAFDGPDVLWAIKNGPGTLYRLARDGGKWRPAAGWPSGKKLHYRDGGGDPDAEGVVATPDGVFAATERDNDGDGSLLKVLRFDTASPAGSLSAAAEWDLTGDLPAVDDNGGFEGITWVPDAFLTANGFRDEHTKAVYDPAAYPGHGSGLYFVGLEDEGMVYAYALTQAGGGFTRVAAFSAGFPAVMELEFEPAAGRLWSVCDDTCGGKTATLKIVNGKFTVSATYARPAKMPNYNNEGFAIAPTCASGRKAVVWADDANDGGHALRAGTLPC
ncbi:esterase-like activity of phytase family protein [Amycolatopsis kentuckyensis]|uniref:esterase-like activity of phytase family protein n=1 Tax=Amycolatopsis kentuckyensis TaxID=218823 RepID=UPI003564523A